MAGIGRNGWPEWSGMSGRDRAEYALDPFVYVVVKNPKSFAAISNIGPPFKLPAWFHGHEPSLLLQFHTARHPLFSHPGIQAILAGAMF